MGRFALIGHPVAGSGSPRLFGAAYGGRHSYELLDGAEFAPLWQTFLDRLDGINITAPYKLDAFRSVDLPSAEARLTGAVNLAVKTSEGIAGYNTDVEGVIRSVRETGLRPERALVVGSGGAGRAAAAGALELGCTVRIWNRTAEKAEALSAAVGAAVAPSLSEAAAWAELVIYTLPGTAPVPEALLSLEGKIVLEAEYRRPQLADIPCLSYLSGKRWLLHQAVAGYVLFTGETPSQEEMEKVL